MIPMPCGPTSKPPGPDIRSPRSAALNLAPVNGRARANPWPALAPVRAARVGACSLSALAVQGLSRRLSVRGEAGEAEEGLADDLALGVEAVGFLIGDLNVNGYLRPRS